MRTRAQAWVPQSAAQEIIWPYHVLECFLSGEWYWNTVHSTYPAPQVQLLLGFGLLFPCVSICPVPVTLLLLLALLRQTFCILYQNIKISLPLESWTAVKAFRWLRFLISGFWPRILHPSAPCSLNLLPALPPLGSQLLFGFLGSERTLSRRTDLQVPSNRRSSEDSDVPFYRLRTSQLPGLWVSFLFLSAAPFKHALWVSLFLQWSLNRSHYSRWGLAAVRPEGSEAGGGL